MIPRSGLDAARSAGYRAGASGQSAIRCPYSGEIRTAWLEGHTEGVKAFRRDRVTGNGLEFGEIKGHRAGVTAGGRV